MTLGTVSKTGKFGLDTEENKEDISPLYRTNQLLSGNTTMVTHQEVYHKGLKYQLVIRVTVGVQPLTFT